MRKLATMSRTRLRHAMFRRAALAMLLLTATAALVLGHPLGNFTVNQFDRLELGPGRIAVRHIVDMAEIPTLQETPRIDANHDGAVSDSELGAYAASVAAEVGPSLSVVVDGAPLALRAGAAHAAFGEGAGGLKTLRIECAFDAAVPAAGAGGSRLRFENGAYAERLGW